MIKRLALGAVFIILAFGVLFITLDILDIAEDYRLYLPINILNTVFIFAPAVLVAYLAARNFTITGLPEMSGLGGAVLAFGAGNLFYVWAIGAGFNIRFTANDSAILLASIIHLFGVSLGRSKRCISMPESGRKPGIILLYYFGILICITIVTLLAFRGVTPPFTVPIIPGYAIVLRDVIQGIGVIFLLTSSLISFTSYYRLRADFYYWYSLGLIIFALGVIFISLGDVESRIAWLGRAAQYFSGIYFLGSVFSSKR